MGTWQTFQFRRRLVTRVSKEDALRDKLEKITALLEGAKTPGERDAAAQALQRIQQAIDGLHTTRVVEMRVTLADRWQMRLFTAVCRRYGIEPYRQKRQRRTTVMIRCEKSFFDQTLWPKYRELRVWLDIYLTESTERLIREEVHRAA